MYCGHCGAFNADGSKFCGSCGVTLEDEAAAASSELWYYENGGKSTGPVSGQQITGLIGSGVIGRSTQVWKTGMASWIPVTESAFSGHFNSPPPLIGQAVSNTIVWWLAFIPVIGLMIEYFVADIFDADASKLWFITLGLNIILCYLDERKLQKAGHNTDAMGGAWLIPVYLFKRASILKQSFGYAIVWCCMFVLLFVAPSTILKLSPFNSITGNSSVVQTVKQGYLNDYPQKTLGKAVDGFLGSPKWKAIRSTDGKDYVNITGNAMYNNRKVDILLQYKVDTESDTFEFYALEIDGKPQNMFTYIGLIEKMYE